MDGCTALHYACQAGHKECILALLLGGADTEKKNK